MVKTIGIKDTVDTGESSPHMTDPNWTQFVLGLLTPEEIINGKPRVAALRRVSQMIIGPIVQTLAQVLQVPTPKNERRATVSVNITFADINTELNDPETCPTYNFSGSADSYYGNTNKFGMYPVAVAETRAEGRALVRALCLNVISAEEAGLVEEVVHTETNNNGTDTQKTYVVMRCGILNIDSNKLTQLLFKKPLDSLNYNELVDVIRKISDYNRDKNSIPDEINYVIQKYDSDLE